MTDPKASDPEEDPKVKVVAVLDVALQATNATSLWTTQNSRMTTFEFGGLFHCDSAPR